MTNTIRYDLSLRLLVFLGLIVSAGAPAYFNTGRYFEALLCGLLGGFALIILFGMWRFEAKPRYPTDNQGSTFPAGFDYMVSKARHDTLVNSVDDLKRYVYVLRDVDVSGLYKIGRSSNLSRRMMAFEVRLPFEYHIAHLIPTVDEVWLEAHLHKRFADKRVRGEWFDLSDSDLDWISSDEWVNDRNYSYAGAIIDGRY